MRRDEDVIKVVDATTWLTAGMTGTVGADLVRSSVREEVKDRVDVFINAYLTANPKQ